MMSFEYKPYLDELFKDVEALCWELSDGEGYFTNYAFVRRVMQAHKAVYIRFLSAMLEDRGDSRPFNLVNQAIGNRLSSDAQKLGYEQDKDSNAEDYDIFGTKKTSSTGVIVYHRTDDVQPV